jgi:phosphoserine phosphatase RsbU/P
VTTDPQPRLAVHDSGGRHVVVIDKARFTIGRAVGHDLQLTDAEVSRDHAEIVASGGGYVLRDRGSRHGTYINGVRAIEHRLAHGDRIELGRTGVVLLFLIDPAASDDEAASAVGDLRQVATLLDALREMGSDRVLDEVLVLVLDSAIAATGAERGFIMLADAPDRPLRMTLARSADRRTLPLAGFETSRKIPEEVFTTGRVKVVADLLEGDMAAVHTGTVALGIRHVLCAPLRLVRYVDRRDAPPSDRNIGVLYLDSRERGRLLSVPARAALEALATQAALAIENARLYTQTLEKARLDKELSIASAIQQALLPDARRTGSFFDAVGASIPSRTIGGDFFDYQTLPDGRFTFSLGDITGKGPAAALLTALVQGVLATCAATVATPEQTVAVVNHVLLSRRVEGRYLTLFLGVLGPDGRFSYCNGGHNPPLLFTASGVRRLDTGGTLIGAFPEPRFERQDLTLAPGDTLVMFSDGVTEAVDQAGEEFAEERVRKVIERCVSESPDRVLEELLRAVRQFADAATPLDDLTAVVVRFTGGVT